MDLNQRKAFLGEFKVATHGNVAPANATQTQRRLFAEQFGGVIWTMEGAGAESPCHKAKPIPTSPLMCFLHRRRGEKQIKAATIFVVVVVLFISLSRFILYVPIGKKPN